MFTVIGGHSVNFWNGTWFSIVVPAMDSRILVFLSEFVNSFHIYAFVLVSGFLYGYLISNGKYKEFLPFVSNKFKRLIIPFVFVCIFWVMPIGYYFYKYIPKDLLYRYVIGISPNQLWFLLMLFWVYIISWWLTNIFTNRRCFSLLIVVIIYCVGVIGSHFFPNVYSIWTGCEYVIFFWIGMQMFYLEDKYKRFSGRWLCLIDGAFLVIFFLLSFLPVPGGVYSLLQIVLHLMGAVAAFSTLQLLATKMNWKENKVFMFLSKRSMPIYLFHQQVIYFTIIWLNGKVNPYVNAVVNFVVAMAVSVLISSILMRFKVTRLLIGEK